MRTQAGRTQNGANRDKTGPLRRGRPTRPRPAFGPIPSFPGTSNRKRRGSASGRYSARFIAANATFSKLEYRGSMSAQHRVLQGTAFGETVQRGLRGARRGSGLRPSGVISVGSAKARTGGTASQTPPQHSHASGPPVAVWCPRQPPKSLHPVRNAGKTAGRLLGRGAIS